MEKTIYRITATGQDNDFIFPDDLYKVTPDRCRYGMQGITAELIKKEVHDRRMGLYSRKIFVPNSAIVSITKEVLDPDNREAWKDPIPQIYES